MAEAQLNGAKRVRTNSRIALSHHTRTLENALGQERTTAAELEGLLQDFNSKKTAVEEAQEAVMLLMDEDYLEQEGENHEEYLVPKNQVKYQAVTRLQTLRGTNGSSSTPDQPDDAESIHSNPVNRTREVKLPKIYLPRFAGDIIVWPPFSEAFLTSVDANPDLSA